ncbi:MAG: mechanosensitive ion channel family protein, partial [FCB group bacterium]|nr:mechanosensitive ion channel family protein [FCB group bacterium]
YQILRPYFLPAGFIFAGLVGGFVFNRILIHRLEQIASRTKWTFDDILLKSLRRYVGIWLFLTGVYFALQTGVVSDKVGNISGKIILVIAVMTVTMVIAGLTAAAIQAYTHKLGTEFQSSNLFVNLIRGVIIAMGLVMLLQTFGISITPIIGAMGIGSLAAGFALKDTLANFFAGIQILASKQLKTGDFLQLSDGQKGYITDITLRNTTLLSRDNNTIVVPNSVLAVEIVLNHNIPHSIIRVKIDCGVAYNSNLDLVENIVREIASEVMTTVEGGVPDFEPNFRFHTFNDFSIDFTVIMRATDYPAQWVVRNEFIKRLKKRFDAEGVVIPFPIRTVVMDK